MTLFADAKINDEVRQAARANEAAGAWVKRVAALDVEMPSETQNGKERHG